MPKKGHPYRCAHCQRIHYRESTKQWIPAACDSGGKLVYTRLVRQKGKK